jgi:hypothetical protein
MYEFDEQPGRVVAESDLLSMRGHVLISQDLRRFDTVGLSSHGCNENWLFVVFGESQLAVRDLAD